VIELLRFMLKEEYRMHTSYTTKRMFLMFPAMVTAFAFAIALTSERIFADTPLPQVLLVLHFSVFLYGMSVGAFGFLGRQYQERSTGYRNYIVTTPATLPMSFKRTFLGMYLRDAIFYVLLLLGPLSLGLALSVPWTGFRLTSIALFFTATLLTFLAGMSLSFFVSTLYLRSVPAFAASMLALIGLFSAYGLFHAVPLEAILPGLGFQYAVPPLAAEALPALAYVAASVLLLLGFLAGAVLLVLEPVLRAGAGVAVRPVAIFSDSSKAAFPASRTALSACALKRIFPCAETSARRALISSKGTSVLSTVRGALSARRPSSRAWARAKRLPDSALTPSGDPASASVGGWACTLILIALFILR